MVPEDRSVTLTFNEFRIEDPFDQDGYCYWDYVEVYERISLHFFVFQHCYPSIPQDSKRSVKYRIIVQTYFVVFEVGHSP